MSNAILLPQEILPNFPGVKLEPFVKLKEKAIYPEKIEAVAEEKALRDYGTTCTREHSPQRTRQSLRRRHPRAKHAKYLTRVRRRR